MKAAGLGVLTVAVMALAVACQGQLRLASGQRHPPRTRRGAASASLRWRPGETFSGSVAFDERNKGAVDEELQFIADERFAVMRVERGVATIRLALASWRWQRNTSPVLTGALPAPTTFDVGSTGQILSGVDWPLPSQLPLPGLDVFAAPLRGAARWVRADADGVDVAYRVGRDSTPAATSLRWWVVRPQFTVSGEPISVSGQAQVTIGSSYVRRGRTAALRSTRERAHYQRTTQSSAGATTESGNLLVTTRFSPVDVGI